MLAVLFIASRINTRNSSGLATQKASPQRTLSDPASANFKQALLQPVPRGRPVVVFSMRGHEEGCRFAGEIYAFLKSNGFTMKEDEVSCDGLALPIPSGVGYRSEAVEFQVIVGLTPSRQ